MITVRGIKRTTALLVLILQSHYLNPHRYRYKWPDLLYRNENTDRYASHWYENFIMRSQIEPENQEIWPRQMVRKRFDT